MLRGNLGFRILPSGLRDSGRLFASHENRRDLQWCNSSPCVCYDGEQFAHTPLQTRARGKKPGIPCPRPDCRKSFGAQHYLQSHLKASLNCRTWRKPHRIGFKRLVRQVTSSESSDELASDEECGHPHDDRVDDTLMNLDQELNGPVWDENGGEETEPVGLEDLDASFTSSPQGIDLQPSAPIDLPGPSVYVEEYNGAAEVLSQQKNLYVELWEKDKLYESRKVGGAHYPFSGDEEWEMVKFLNPLTVKQVNEFLKQPYVRSGISTQIVI